MKKKIMILTIAVCLGMSTAVVPKQVLYASEIEKNKDEIDLHIWKCTQTLNAPDSYTGGAVRLELIQEADGKLKASVVSEGTVLTFPYKLDITGISGVSTGTLYCSELIDGVYQELGHYPIKFEKIESEKEDDTTGREDKLMKLQDINAELQEQINELTAKIALLEQENSNLKAEIENLKSSSSSKTTITTDKTVNYYCDADGCYREGTKSLIGFSGLTEYYCSTHYSEMEDIISMMEEDVGTSSSSKHTCDADGCYKEGTNSIIGLSGLTEYYCTAHYNDMADIISMLLGGY